VIKIATIYLHDTGLLDTSGTTAVSGSGNISNNGEEIPLKIRTLKFSIGLGFDNSPTPGASENDVFQRPKLTMGSIVSPLITLAGQINRKGDVSSDKNEIYKMHGSQPTLTDESGDSITNEVKMLGLLEHASRTKGYKELYYKSTDADNLFYGIATDTETANSTYNCFIVRIKSIDITETPDSELITWSCTLEITR